MDIVSLEKCRLCLGETNSLELISIWSETDNHEFNTISEQIMEVAAVTIEEDDNLSQFICTACCYSTDQFLHFKMQCERNEKIQRELLLKSMEDPVDSTAIEKKIIVPLEISLINHESPEYTVFMESMKVEKEEEVVCDSLIADEIEFKNLVFDEEIGAPVETIWLSEVGKSVVECDKCGELFDNDDILDQHTASGECDVKSVDQDEEFVDDSTVDYEEELPRKPQAINPKKLRPESCVCETCGKVICSPTFLRRHIKAIHPAVFKVKYKKVKKPNGPVQCDLCGKVLLSKTSLIRHTTSLKCKSRDDVILAELENEPVDEEFEKNVENSEFSADTINADATSEDKKSKCYICGKMVSFRLFLRHIKYNHVAVYNAKYKNANLPKVRCDNCGKLLRNKHLLKFHLCKADASGRKIGEKRRRRRLTQCSVCGKMILSQWIKRHMQAHTGEKPFKCKFCNKSLATNATLKSHERQHTGENPLTCKVCGRIFYGKYSLENHEKLHSDETPYACSVCNRGFKTHNHLNYHESRCKTKVRSHHCEICDKSFLLAADLQTHNRIHTLEKIHACHLCDYKSIRQAGLRAHMQKHSSEKKFKCDLCPAVLSYRAGLLRHKRNLHPKSLPSSDVKVEKYMEFEGDERELGDIMSYLDS